MSDGQPLIRVMEKAARVLDCLTPAHTRLSLSDLRRMTHAQLDGRPPGPHPPGQRGAAEDGRYCVGLRVLGWAWAASAGVYIRRGTTRVAVMVKLSTRVGDLPQ